MSLLTVRRTLWACFPLAALVAAGCGGGGSSTPGTTPGDTDGGVGDAGSDVCDPTVQACGGCQTDNNCPAGSICDPSSHQCSPGCNASHACQTGRQCCTGSCVDLQNDAKNCGACASSCAGGPHSAGACKAGKCALACDKGFDDCNASLSDGCETTTGNDVKNCGGCGKACSAANVTVLACESGVCTGACNAGYADCDGDKQKNGCEASLQTDPGHCGACGAACSSQHLTGASCVKGECSGACAPGWGDCNGNKQSDGCETNFDSDAKNCGACSVLCSNNHVAAACSTGVCSGACETGWSDCNGNLLTDGCEIPTSSDPNNCGGCGSKCSPNHLVTVSCSAGSCNGACQAGFADCNGNKQLDGLRGSAEQRPVQLRNVRHCLFRQPRSSVVPVRRVRRRMRGGLDGLRRQQAGERLRGSHRGRRLELWWMRHRMLRQPRVGGVQLGNLLGRL